MKSNIKISKRLQKVASFVSPAAYFADIGSDHAYLPAFICLADKQAKAIAGEVSTGPYHSANQTVEALGLTNEIDVQLGDGLDVINDDVTEVTIAGMGGALIASIIEEGKGKLYSIDKMIVQPNNNEHLVRKIFLKYNYDLTNEVIIEENNHTYEILVAQKSSSKKHYNPKVSLDKQLLFGPILMQEKSILFIEKWERERRNIKNMIYDIKKSKHDNQSKINQLTEQLNWIEEVLN